MDGMWMITLGFALPLTRLVQKLSENRPTASVLGLCTMASAVGILAINFVFKVIALTALWNQDWFQCHKWENNGNDDGDCNDDEDPNTIPSRSARPTFYEFPSKAKGKTLRLGVARPNLSKLVPRLLRACNDPNKQTREQIGADKPVDQGYVPIGPDISGTVCIDLDYLAMPNADEVGGHYWNSNIWGVRYLGQCCEVQIQYDSDEKKTWRPVAGRWSICGPKHKTKKKQKRKQKTKQKTKKKKEKEECG
jgi:hypothetical protein